jgi:hypothetical protein
MRKNLTPPLLLALAALILAAGAIPRAPNADRAPGGDAEAAPPSDAAIDLLDRALAAVAPDRLPWLQTGVWQKVRLPGLTYEAEGRYLTAPGHRFRLELRTTLGNTPGELVLVSDGRHLWRGTRLGGGDWAEVGRAALRSGFDMPDGPGWPQARSGAGNGLTFSGVGPLLSNLRERLVWVAAEKKEGRVELTGVWPADVRSALVAESRSWPAGMPRQCRLSLDETTLWPRRVEWWGPPTEGGDSDLLAVVELRQPICNRPLAPAEAAAVFAFDPGNAAVSERHVDE